MSAGLANIDVAVLCGGKGTRIRPVLGDTPKCLAPIAPGMTYLDWLFRKLSLHGAKRVILVAGNGGYEVLDYVSAHMPDFDVKVDIEENPCGTAGAIRWTIDLLTSEPVMIVNGDTMIDADLDAFVARHDPAWVTQLYLKPFVDKRPPERRGAYHAGFTLAPQWKLDELAKTKAADLDVAMSGSVRQLVLPGHFLDIGVPDRLEAARTFLEQMNEALT